VHCVLRIRISVLRTLRATQLEGDNKATRRECISLTMYYRNRALVDDLSRCFSDSRCCGKALIFKARARPTADAAGLHKNSVAYWERCPDIPTDRFLIPLAVQNIEEALRRDGVRLFVSREFRVRVGAVSRDQLSPQYARVREQPATDLTGEKQATHG
jgi:hypothetical protein